MASKLGLWAIEATNVETGVTTTLTGIYSKSAAEECVRTLQSAQRVMKADSAFNFAPFRIS